MQMAYVIDSDLCDGCGLCAPECVMEAIAADGQGAYTIDADLCTDCGTCLDVCPLGAVSGFS